jgi:hypothetical protein
MRLLLIDGTMADSAAILRERARDARRLADYITDEEARQALLRLASEYEAKAAEIEADNTPPDGDTGN